MIKHYYVKGKRISPPKVKLTIDVLSDAKINQDCFETLDNKASEIILNHIKDGKKEL